ncbi:hypothetical protein IFM89_038980 [Coptis chinensis]|uniref:Zinc finger FPG/IleRS-type domain-containing protein n=1 Tax=Coptis chinensis TaxID=261450 RepID=A0A835LL28_9MAGN|nr:hypothetical protein IFM89_038980 [Coptis chinensis]
MFGQLRTEVNKVLETARSGKLIGSSLDAKIYLHSSDADLSSKLHETCASSNDADELHRIFITSQVEILSSMGNGIAESIPYSGDCLIQGKKVWVGVSRADGSKCERCWNYSTKVGSFSEHPTLCSRCYNVVGVQPLPVVAAVEEMFVLAVHEYRVISFGFVLTYL